MGAIFKIWDDYISPATNAGQDIGSSALQFKDLWLDGIAYLDEAQMDTAGKVQFRDANIYISSKDDGHLDIDADISIDFNTATDTDLVLNFTGTTNSGVLTWMEDEDYFQFSDDILMNTTEKIQFRDTGLFIVSNDDGVLDIDVDTRLDLNIGTTAQINLTDGKLAPTTDNDIDLGDSTHEYKDGYFDGTLYTDGRILNVVTKTSTYTATTDDDVIICNSTTAFTINLPTASGSGRRFIIKNINTGTITIDGDTSDTIDGDTTQSLFQWDGIQISDYVANKWVVV